jgi:hypothetical protein
MNVEHEPEVVATKTNSLKLDTLTSSNSNSNSSNSQNGQPTATTPMGNAENKSVNNSEEYSARSNAYSTNKGIHPDEFSDQELTLISGVFGMQGARTTMEDKHTLLTHPVFNKECGLTDSVPRSFYAGLFSFFFPPLSTLPPSLSQPSLITLVSSSSASSSSSSFFLLLLLSSVQCMMVMAVMSLPNTHDKTFI